MADVCSTVDQLIKVFGPISTERRTEHASIMFFKGTLRVLLVLLHEFPELPEGFLFTFFLLVWVGLVLDCPLDG
jgi:hypothetical protein